MPAKLNPEARRSSTVMGISPEADQLASTRQRVATVFGLDASTIQVANPRGERAKVKEYDAKARRRPSPVKSVAAVPEINDGQTVMMEGVENGRQVWLKTIAGMSMGCYEELQGKFLHDIANDAALFYGTLLDSFTIPEEAMVKATSYAEQRQLGLDDSAAKEVVAGKRAPLSRVVTQVSGDVGINLQSVVVDPDLAVILPVQSHPRLKVAAIILGLGVALAGGVYSVRKLVNNVVATSSQTQQR